MFITAGLVHRTAIVAILYPLIVFVRKQKRYYIKIILSGIAVVAVASFGIQIIVRMYRINDYSSQIVVGQGLKLLILEFLIILILSYIKKQKYQIANIDVVAMNSCTTGLLIQGMTAGFDILYRLTLYFTIFYSVLIPNIVTKQKVSRNIKICVTIAGLFLYYTYCLMLDSGAIVPYMMFWSMK